MRNIFLPVAAVMATTVAVSAEDFTPAPYDYEYLSVSEIQRQFTSDNVATLRQIFNEAIYPQDWDRLRELYADNYVQHNPDMEDGKEGVIKLFRSLDYDQLVYETFMTIAEGPYVIALSKLQFAKDAPVLGVIDINFITEGKSREHWDIIMPVEDAESFFSVSQAATPQDQATIDANKALAAEFVNVVFNRGEAEKARDYIGDTYIQHGRGDNSADSVVKLAQTAFRGGTIDIKRIVAQDDLVMMHSRVSLRGQDFARADVWRVTDGKLTEHWGFMQPVPDQMAHRNGMF